MPSAPTPLMKALRKENTGAPSPLPTRTPQFAPYSPRYRFLLAFLLGLAALVLAVALWDYQPEQSPWITTRSRQLAPCQENLVGMAGVAMAFFSLRWLGAASWLLPLYTLGLALTAFQKRPGRFAWIDSLLLLAGLSACSGLVSLLQTTLLAPYLQPKMPNPYYTAGFGGLVGDWLFIDLLKRTIGSFGSFLFFFTGALGAPLWVFRKELQAARYLAALGPALRKLGQKLRQWGHGLGQIMARKKHAENGARRILEASLPKASSAAPLFAPEKQPSLFEADPEALDPLETRLPQQSAASEGAAMASQRLREGARKIAAPLPPTEAEPADWSEAESIAPPGPDRLGLANATPVSGLAADAQGLRVIEGERVERAPLAFEGSGDYIPPDPSLLMEVPEPLGASLEDHAYVAERLRQTLEEFGIKATMGEVHTGPVITRYEVLPAAGVRVEKISNLDKNIAMTLKAVAVRILAPVPGKGCVGIEVPNSKPAPVCIRDILESKAWAGSEAEIPLALGKEVSGKPLVSDLTKMPHLLIAGSTGSGKTVCINSIITSLLFHAGPEDLRFIMVDPKIVEMQVYNKLPHMLIPVVTDPKKVPGALKWLLGEMERRYQIFAKLGVRNIAGFNAKQANLKEAQDKQKELEAALSPEERVALNSIEVPRDPFVSVPPKLPYIVCIIDELADLMMVAAADIETSIARLAQLARAAGIHMIIATQRPSVNVITGIIKANLPCRIAFKVASKVDSRTILDCMGADQLIGRGDLLFLPPGTASLVRAQGALVSDDEINRIVDYIHDRNGPPQFVQAIQDQIDQTDEEDWEEEGTDQDGDPLIPEALDVLRTSQRASTSMLQRRLSIGYNRAARIMEILENRGYVGPENGAKPREILKEWDG